VPLISLALTTSGANLSSSLPDTVSPSRLLQASSLLRSADDAYELTQQPVQVGPPFLVKFYSIFTSHARVNSVKDIQWKEEFAKCRATIVRIPSRAHKETETGAALENGSAGISAGYEYELRLLEDLDDGRYHEELENWGRKQIKEEIAGKGYIEGRVRHIPVHKVATCKRF
jgi:RanGTP-binding protein